MDIPKLKQRFKDNLANLRKRSHFVEEQKAARAAAFDRLIRAEAISVAATLHELLSWLPGLKVETAYQSAAVAVSVTAPVTGEDYVSVSGLVALEGDFLTTDYDALNTSNYALLDGFTGDIHPIASREALVQAVFGAFSQSYLQRYKFALSDPKLRDHVLLNPVEKQKQT